MNKKLKKQNGITLIALVITIIVMLILVAVTINMAINRGLFSYAGKAAGDMQNAIDKENELASGRIEVDGVWYASIDDYLKGLPEGIKVGDYVNYTPDTETYKVADGKTGTGYTTDEGYQEFTTESFKWRILSIDEATGKIELVAKTQSSTKLTLCGADGYNHAVDILNDLCETLYSKTENGKKVATGRSINVEDVNAKTTYIYKDYTGNYKYGTVKPLSEYSTSYRKYPNLYSQETGYYEGNTGITGLSGSEGKNDGETDTGTNITTYSTVTGYTDDNVDSKNVKFTYTYYYYAPENHLNTDLGINTAPTGLIKTGTTYWLASRCVYAGSDYARFRVRYVYSDGSVDDRSLFYSYGDVNDPSYAVRPVVSLASSVKLTKDTTNSTDSVTYWNLSF